MGAIHSRSDCLGVFIFLLTVISGRGEREDFKIHLKVIKLALGPLTRARLSLQWPAAPRGGEVGCPGKLGTGRYLCAPRPRRGGHSPLPFLGAVTQVRSTAWQLRAHPYGSSLDASSDQELTPSPQYSLLIGVSPSC